MKKILFYSLILIIILSGCSSDNSNKTNDEKVNYVQAKEMIINDGALMVDVRTKDEYDEGHIEGAVLLPVDEITEDSVKKIVDSKDSIMIVYCKSGVRSNQAAIKLKELGYKNVYDLGSISNWNE